MLVGSSLSLPGLLLYKMAIGDGRCFLVCGFFGFLKLSYCVVLTGLGLM